MRYEEIWCGVRFLIVSPHDVRHCRAPGLVCWVRRETDLRRTPLWVGEAEVISQLAIQGSQVWAYALALGVNETHIAIVRGTRLDRLGLKAHLVKRLGPPLNPPSKAREVGLAKEDALPQTCGEASHETLLRVAQAPVSL